MKLTDPTILQALSQGKRIRREAWDGDLRIFADDTWGGRLGFETAMLIAPVYILSTDELSREDWEVCE